MFMENSGYDLISRKFWEFNEGLEKNYNYIIYHHTIFSNLKYP